MLETDLILVRFRLGQVGDLGIFQHIDIFRKASDQRGHVDGAFTRDHHMTMSNHALDG